MPPLATLVILDLKGPRSPLMMIVDEVVDEVVETVAAAEVVAAVVAETDHDRSVSFKHGATRRAGRS